MNDLNKYNTNKITIHTAPVSLINPITFSHKVNHCLTNYCKAAINQ